MDWFQETTSKNSICDGDLQKQNIKCKLAFGVCLISYLTQQQVAQGKGKGRSGKENRKGRRYKE